MRARGDEGRRGDGASRDQGAEGKREERQLDSTQRDFLAMLAALAPLPDPKWKHVRERVRADPRYDAVRSREREELFEMHLASARQALASHVAPLSLSPLHALGQGGAYCVIREEMRRLTRRRAAQVAEACAARELQATASEEDTAAALAEAPPPPFPRTNRTSLVPPLVLRGHAASLR